MVWFGFARRSEEEDEDHCFDYLDELEDSDEEENDDE